MRQQYVTQALLFSPASPGLSFHADVYIFSLPPSPACLMNFQSVRCSISALLLFFLPRSRCLSFMTYSCANAWSLAEGCAGMRGLGGSTVGLHVFMQTEIFMYVGLCRCVRAPSRVPLLALCIYVSLHGYGIKNTAAWKDAGILICVLQCARVHVRRSLPGDAWSLVVWFSSQMKTLHINYPWPALHGLAQPTEEQELTEHTSVILHNRVQGTYLKCRVFYM